MAGRLLPAPGLPAESEPALLGVLLDQLIVPEQIVVSVWSSKFKLHYFLLGMGITGCVSMSVIGELGLQ